MMSKYILYFFITLSLFAQDDLHNVFIPKNKIVFEHKYGKNDLMKNMGA